MYPCTCRPPRAPRQPPAAPCPPRPPSRCSPLSCPMGLTLDSFLGRDTETVWRESETAAGGDYDITRISWEHCVISGDERRLCAHQLQWQISAKLTRRSRSARGPPGGCRDVEMVKRRQTECLRAVSAVPTVSSSGSVLITQIRVCSG